MKIIIADDENLSRSSLKSMLDELELPLEVVGEAKNGEVLVALVESLSPDLVFADIRMPRLSGLEALRTVRGKAPSTNWVMLTGFADFEYAREALRLGALNYLLKPAALEDLRSCVVEALEKHREIVISLNLKFESDIVSLLHDMVTLEELDAVQQLKAFRFRGTVCYVDSSIAEEEKALLRKQFIAELQNIAAELLTSQSVRFGLANLPDGNLSFFTAWHTEPLSAAAELIEQFERRVELAVSRFKSERLSVTALRTGSCASFGETLEQLTLLAKLAGLRNVLSIGSVHSLTDLQAVEQVTDLAELSRHLEKAVRFLADKDFTAYAKELAQLEKVYTDQQFSDAAIFQAVCDFLYYAVGCKLHDLRERNAWFAALHRQNEGAAGERTNEYPMQSDLVRRVIQHVREHYMKDIGIGQIAADINVTPNYLSTLFHRRTGTTFMKYLTEIRMLKAKELLAGTNLKVQQVAEEVGYYSTRHFTKLFKDYFGIYPSELREKLVH